MRVTGALTRPVRDSNYSLSSGLRLSVISSSIDTGFKIWNLIEFRLLGIKGNEGETIWPSSETAYRAR